MSQPLQVPWRSLLCHLSGFIRFKAPHTDLCRGQRDRGFVVDGDTCVSSLDCCLARTEQPGLSGLTGGDTQSGVFVTPHAVPFEFLLTT